MADSSDIDNAVVALLSADATLLGLMPNGVYWDEAAPGSTRFVRISLVTPHDARSFQGRSIESVLYAVTAVALSTTNPNMKAAAARIDELLDPQPPAAPAALTPAGFTLMATYRDEEVPRIRHTEVDEADPTIRWFVRGGHYWVVMST